MKSHKFDVEDAEKYGVNKAIILQHLKFHQSNNEGIEEYEIDGKIWCHARRKTLVKMYPYFSARSISRWLTELEENGVIESCKPRINGGDHTKYYRVSGYENGNGQNDQRVVDDNAENTQKQPSFHLTGNGQNGQSNGQNDHSARDNKVQGNGQNGHSSNSNYSVTNYVKGRARVNGVPLPDELTDVEGFAEKFDFYCQYMKENYQRWPTSTTTEVRLQKLARLKRKGHDPIAVINQTIEAGNKSFYPIRDFEDTERKNKTSTFRHDAIHL